MLFYLKEGVEMNLGHFLDERREALSFQSHTRYQARLAKHLCHFKTGVIFIQQHLRV